MANIFKFELSITTNINNKIASIYRFNELILSSSSTITNLKFTTTFSAAASSTFLQSQHTFKRRKCGSVSAFELHVTNAQASCEVTAPVENAEIEIANGYTLTEFCDKMIDLFINEKPKSKDWKKYLVFREEWKKYSECFYRRCQTQADKEVDPKLKQKLISLERKVKKVDDEMEMHTELLKEIQDSPTDINSIIVRRRKDFTGDFFTYLTLLSETYDSLEDQDAMARLGAKCLSAASAYDNTLQYVDTLDVAQAKFDEILNSPSIDVACDKIKSLARAKELDSSLILLINAAWASTKVSKTMKNEVKEIMFRIYKATKSSLRTIVPKEIKLLKHLLNITDPEDRFSALAEAFSPGDGHESKDPNALYTDPKELHKWIKIMLDAYHLNKEETDIREAKQMCEPIVIQRLIILKETIEDEYFDQTAKGDENKKSDNRK